MPHTLDPITILSATDFEAEAAGYWLAGLVDGEGCFSLFTTRRRVGRSPDCRVVNFSFKISLRDDDRPALESAQKILGGIGLISSHGKKREATRGARVYQGKPICGLVVTDKQQLMLVVAFFRRYPLRCKKRRDFDTWAAALERFRHLTLNAPRTWLSKGKLVRATRVGPRGRRPPEGTPRQHFKKIPDEVFIEMQQYELKLKEGRQYYPPVVT